MKPTIIIDDKIPFIKGAFESLANVVYLNGADINNDNVRNADALIVRTRTQCNENLLKNSSVKFIATATIGFDHIDTEYCKAHNIVWANAPGSNADSVKQYLASTLFYLQKQLNFKLTDCTIGIVGVGNVGKRVAGFCNIIGMKVLLNDPPRQAEEKTDVFVSINEIAEKCDIITFHTPLIKSGENKTYHLANEKLLSKLKRKPVIVNTSRGEICDSDALKSALKNGIISAVVLDCWENEPNIDPELLQQCIIATPHIAGYSADGKANATTAAVRYISKCLQLNIDNWQVQSLPQPDNNRHIEVEYINKDDILQDVILKAYNINEDSCKLKSNITHFEFLRNHYPVRREFPYYTVTLRKNNAEIITLLKKLGFK